MSLEHTYVAIFEFFQAVAGVFSTRGKARATAAVVADLLWKPFDLRFRNVVDKINFHQGIVREELDFTVMTKIQDDIEALQDIQAELATRKAQQEIFSISFQAAEKIRQADKWSVDGGPEFDHVVIVSCRGIIEKKRNGVFKYIHLTARKFAQNGPDGQCQRPPLLPKELIAKATIAIRCVSYLASKVP
ncbi:hypothetical protein B0H63DRAFT_137981 [Podospora didyma]|uniref:Uncharacterized protein n=1 Tax=Podospora didyma TaxID=330526 RepID=A0AAE0NRY5_9PEZI|nr:hypothetical protein B0H63DRAFT_137981 [Podospora didyma]